MSRSKGLVSLTCHMDESAFREMADAAIAVLDGIVIDDYYGPHGSVDDQLASLSETLIGASPEQRQTFSSSLTKVQRRTFGRHILRSPMLALRARQPHYLREGLLTFTLLHQGTGDWRDDLITLTPYYCTARELGLEPDVLFGEASQHAAPEMAKIMQTFGRRTDVTLEVFGWRQVETPDGPTFATGEAVVGDRSWDRVNQALVDDLMRWVQNSKQ